MSDLTRAIESYVSKCDTKPTYCEIEEHIGSILEKLRNDGTIAFGQDKDLMGRSLELRVTMLFASMNFSVKNGRKSLEDCIIEPPSGFTPDTPLVLEVKSSKHPNIDRSDLRQLDDWVFDLSGEEQVRKDSLDGGRDFVGGDIVAFASLGVLTSKKTHPTPHKGVMIFNGPAGEEFDRRTLHCINPNDAEFVSKRNFCIIPFSVLIAHADECANSQPAREAFWQKVHKTAGIMT